MLLAGDLCNVIPTAAGCPSPRRLERRRIVPAADAARSSVPSSTSGSPTQIARRATRPTSATFWDYQAGAWAKDNGIRIDHLLLSSAQRPDLMMTGTGIDRHAAGTSTVRPRPWHLCRSGSRAVALIRHAGHRARVANAGMTEKSVTGRSTPPASGAGGAASARSFARLLHGAS